MTTNKRHSPEQIREIERKRREILEEARGENMDIDEAREKYYESAEKYLLALANRREDELSNEVEELRNTPPWKYWSRNEKFEREEAREEAINILHFLLQVFDELGMDASDIYNEYMEKNEVNHCRQDGDY